MHFIWHTPCRTTKRNCKEHEYSSLLEYYTLLTSKYSSYQYLEESTGQAVQESSQVAWLFLILYIFFEKTMQMLFHKILVTYTSSFLTSFFSLVCLLFLWLLSEKCPLFLLQIYGNHNQLHILETSRNLIHVYLQSRQTYWCPYVQDMCHT